MSRRPTQAAVPLAAEAAEPPARSARLIGADSSAAGPAGARLALASVACTAPGTRGPTLPERPEDPDNANPTRQLAFSMSEAGIKSSADRKLVPHRTHQRR
jgi:hypothetical protein